MYTAKEDVLMTAAIELERVFTVLSNVYNPDKFPEHAGFLPKIETELRGCLNRIKQTEIDANPRRDGD